MSNKEKVVVDIIRSTKGITESFIRSKTSRP